MLDTLTCEQKRMLYIALAAATVGAGGYKWMQVKGGIGGAAAGAAAAYLLLAGCADANVSPALPGASSSRVTSDGVAKSSVAMLPQPPGATVKDPRLTVSVEKPRPSLLASLLSNIKFAQTTGGNVSQVTGCPENYRRDAFGRCVYVPPQVK